jgi:hypothetical protein
VPKEDRADFGGAKRQAEMAGRTGVHGVDGETARLIGRFGEEMSLQRHEKNPVRRRARNLNGKARIWVGVSLVCHGSRIDEPHETEQIAAREPEAS